MKPLINLSREQIVALYQVRNICLSDIARHVDDRHFGNVEKVLGFSQALGWLLNESGCSNYDQDQEERLVFFSSASDSAPSAT